MILQHHPTAEARPITAHRHDQVELVAVPVTADHPLHRQGIVYLSPDQLDCVHAALTSLIPGRYGRFAVGCGAEVVQRRQSGNADGEDLVCIRTAHPFGDGTVELTAREARAIRRRLGQIAIAFLHENVLGGEDATAQ